MTVSILVGDCRDMLATLPDCSVQCCVTSPPYFGLRDYGTATWEGGDPACDHKHQLGGEGEKSAKQKTSAGMQMMSYRDVCRKCGAKRTDSQIGLEPTPDAYVAEMVAVFREVRRVLRDDGTLWLNIGDSYAGSWGAQGHRETEATVSRAQISNHPKRASHTGTIRQSGLKPKDLIGIPWLVAFALRADGWWLRQEIIWAKPNPMPESVTDRCTKAHESVFLLSKGPRYFFDAKAIAEPAETAAHHERYADAALGYAKKQPGQRQSGMMGVTDGGTRNRRSVWAIATQPYSGAHFATMPPQLAEDCIKAGSKPGDMILDPFGGAGTTALVADRLQRDATIIELNPVYAVLARERINGEAGLFAPAAE